MPTCPNPRHSRFQQERPVDAAVTMAYVIEPLHSLDLILHVIQPKKDPSHTFKDISYVLKKSPNFIRFAVATSPLHMASMLSVL